MRIHLGFIVSAMGTRIRSDLYLTKASGYDYSTEAKAAHVFPTYEAAEAACNEADAQKLGGTCAWLVDDLYGDDEE